jgi:hypothetical protein
MIFPPSPELSKAGENLMGLAGGEDGLRFIQGRRKFGDGAGNNEGAGGVQRDDVAFRAGEFAGQKVFKKEGILRGSAPAQVLKPGGGEAESGRSIAWCEAGRASSSESGRGIAWCKAGRASSSESGRGIA